MGISFFILGEPAPGGSKTAIPRRDAAGNLITKMEFSKRYGREVPVVSMLYIDAGGERRDIWVKACQRAARAHFPYAPLDVPIRALFQFYIRRPKYHHEASDRRRPLKPEFLDVTHDPSPADSLKLRRSTEDALTGIVWRDDCLIVQGYDEKLYAASSEPTGCRVMVSKVIPDHAPEGLFSQEAMSQ